MEFVDEAEWMDNVVMVDEPSVMVMMTSISLKIEGKRGTIKIDLL